MRIEAAFGSAGLHGASGALNTACEMEALMRFRG